MHSFSGAWATAESCLAMGLHVSFAGMVTYKNAQDLRDVAAKVPLDRMLVETDSPYLSPVPLRGKVNEPAHVSHTAACLAGVLGMDVDGFARQTTRNAQRYICTEIASVKLRGAANNPNHGFNQSSIFSPGTLTKSWTL